MEDWTDWIQRVIGSVDDVREEWLGTPGATASPDMPAELRQRVYETLSKYRELPSDQAQVFRQSDEFREAILAADQYVGKGRSKLERTVTDPYESSPFGLLELGLPLAAGAASVYPPTMPFAPALWTAAAAAAAPSVIPRGIQGAHDVVAGQLGDENVGKLGDIKKVVQPSEWGPEAEMGPLWDVLLGRAPFVPSLGKSAMKHDWTRGMRTGPRAGRRAGMLGGKDFYRRRFAGAEKPWEYAPKFRDVSPGNFPKHYMPEYNIPNILRRTGAKLGGDPAVKALGKSTLPVPGLSPWKPSTWKGAADDVTKVVDPKVAGQAGAPIKQAGVAASGDPGVTTPTPTMGRDFLKPTQKNVKAWMDETLTELHVDYTESQLLNSILQRFDIEGLSNAQKAAYKQQAIGNFKKIKQTPKWKKRVELAKQGHDPAPVKPTELRDPTLPVVKITPKAKVFDPSHVPQANKLQIQDFMDPETGIFHIAEGLPDSRSNRVFRSEGGKNAGFKKQITDKYLEETGKAGEKPSQNLLTLASKDPMSRKISPEAADGIRAARKTVEDAINRSNPNWRTVKGHVEPFEQAGYWAGDQYVPRYLKGADASVPPKAGEVLPDAAGVKVADDVPPVPVAEEITEAVTDAATPVAKRELVNWNAVPEDQILDEVSDITPDGFRSMRIKMGGRQTTKIKGKPTALIKKVKSQRPDDAKKLGIDLPEYTLYRRPFTSEYRASSTQTRENTVYIYKAVDDKTGLTSEWNNSPTHSIGELDDALMRMAQRPDEGIAAAGKSAYIHFRGGNVEDFLYPQPGKQPWAGKTMESADPSVTPKPVETPTGTARGKGVDTRSEVQKELDANLSGDFYDRTGLNIDLYTDTGAVKPLEEVAAGLRAKGWGEDNIEVFLGVQKRVLAKDAKLINEGRDPGQERIQEWHQKQEAIQNAATVPDLRSVDGVKVAQMEAEAVVKNKIVDPGNAEVQASKSDQAWLRDIDNEWQVAGKAVKGGTATPRQAGVVAAEKKFQSTLAFQLEELEINNPGAHARLMAEKKANSPIWHAIQRMGMEYSLQQTSFDFMKIQLGFLQSGEKVGLKAIKGRTKTRGKIGTQLAREFEASAARGIPPKLAEPTKTIDEARAALIDTQGADQILVTDDFLRNWSNFTPEQGKALQGSLTDPKNRAAVETAIDQVRKRLNAENQAARDLGTRYDRLFTLVQQAEMPNLAQIYRDSGSKKAFDAATANLRKFYGQSSSEGGHVVSMMGLGKIPTEWPKGWPKGGAGFMTADIALKMGGFAVGSTTGWGLYSEEVRGQDFDPGQQAWAAMGLGVAGFMGPTILNKIARSGDPFKGTSKARSKMDNFLDLQYFNILQSPDTIMKALGGAFGGTHVGAFELFLGGFINGNPQEMLLGYRVLNKLYSRESVKLFGEALLNPEAVKQRIMGNLPGRIKNRLGVLGMPGRAFTAGDVVAVNALKAGEFTTKESARYTLAGEPATEIGKNVLDWIQNRSARHGTGGKRLYPGKTPTDPQGKLLASVVNMATLFPRVGILSIEGGIARFPGVAPAMKALDIGGGLKPKTYGQGIAQSVAGAAGIGAGYQTADEYYEPATWAVLSALGGPLIGLYALGYAGRRGMQRPQGDAFTGALQGIREVNPMGADPFRLFSEQFLQESQRRVIPGLVTDAARAMDPAFGRKTGPSELQGAGYGVPAQYLGQLIASTPKLRERLPETPAPVNVYGEPTFLPDKDRELGALSKPFFPNPVGHGAPAMNVEKPELAWLADKGIMLSSPQGNITVPDIGLPVETGGELKSEMQRATGVAVEEAAKMVASHFNDLPPGTAPPRVKKLIQDLMSMHVRKRLEESGIPLMLILRNPVQFIEAAETGQELR